MHYLFYTHTPPTPHCCCLGRFVSKFPISHVCPVQSRFPECWGGFCLVLCSPCSQHRRWEGDAVPRHLCSCSWEETQPPRAASMDCADGPPSSRWPALLCAQHWPAKSWLQLCPQRNPDFLPASAHPGRGGASGPSSDWTMSLCCCKSTLASFSVDRDRFATGKFTLEFTLNFCIRRRKKILGLQKKMQSDFDVPSRLHRSSPFLTCQKPCWFTF